MTPSAADQSSASFLDRPVELLVFDLDGTLIDSREDLATAVNATLLRFGRVSLPLDRIAGFIGDGASMLVDRALAATGGTSPALLQEAMPAFLRFYRRHLLDHTYVYDGVLAALHRISAAAPSLPMAILTNKPVMPSKRICEALGLSTFFFANYGGDSFATKKPDPLGLQWVMQEAAVLSGRAVLPEATVLIGDSDVDVRTARAAGARSLGCTYGLATKAMLAAAPDAVVASAAEWPAIFGLQERLHVAAFTAAPLQA